MLGRCNVLSYNPDSDQEQIKDIGCRCCLREDVTTCQRHYKVDVIVQPQLALTTMAQVM